MSVIRAFIALDITQKIQQRLDEVTQLFKVQLDGIPIRWVPCENIHLTLKFLGDVSESNLEMLTDILNIEATRHSSFEVSVGGVGAYPRITNPRVIWVGVEAPPDLMVLQNGIANELEKLGYAQEKRSYSPHLTIGRVGRNVAGNDLRRVSKVIESNKIGFLGVFPIQEVYLYKSDLKPSGAVYTKIFATQLHT
jgi:2'-5' RNA ligase